MIKEIMKHVLLVETDYERRKLREHLFPIKKKFSDIQFSHAPNDSSFINWLSNKILFIGLIYNSPSIYPYDPYSLNATDETNGLQIIKFLKTPKSKTNNFTLEEEKQYSQMKKKFHIYSQKFEKINKTLETIPIFMITSDMTTEGMIQRYLEGKDLSKSYINSGTILKEINKYEQAKKENLITSYGPAFNDSGYSKRFLDFIKLIDNIQN